MSSGLVLRSDPTSANTACTHAWFCARAGQRLGPIVCPPSFPSAFTDTIPPDTTTTGYLIVPAFFLSLSCRHWRQGYEGMRSKTCSLPSGLVSALKRLDSTAKTQAPLGSGGLGPAAGGTKTEEHEAKYLHASTPAPEPARRTQTGAATDDDGVEHEQHEQREQREQRERAVGLVCGRCEEVLRSAQPQPWRITRLAIAFALPSSPLHAAAAAASRQQPSVKSFLARGGGGERPLGLSASRPEKRHKCEHEEEESRRERSDGVLAQGTEGRDRGVRAVPPSERRGAKARTEGSQTQLGRGAQEVEECDEPGGVEGDGLARPCDLSPAGERRQRAAVPAHAAAQARGRGHGGHVECDADQDRNREDRDREHSRDRDGEHSREHAQAAAKGGGVSVSHGGTRAPQAASATLPGVASARAGALETLRQMGFSEQSTARRALDACGDNVQRAVEWLLRPPPPRPSGACVPGIVT